MLNKVIAEKFPNLEKETPIQVWQALGHLSMAFIV
jgi:hypothetical protein